jgi:transposase InsO family protein
MSDEHEVQSMCEALQVSRSGYYQWLQRQGTVRSNDVLIEQIVRIHQQSEQRYGSPRVVKELARTGVRAGHNRVARLMREAGLQGRQQKRFRVMTTDSDHDYPIAPNRLAQGSRPGRANEVWVADITYIPTDEGALYLAGVMDLCTRRLIGWAMDTSMETALPLNALIMAIRQIQPGRNVLHHSDRGSQYASAEYTSTLRRHGFIASMSRTGNCYDNAYMESFWSTLKLELIYRYRFATRRQASLAIFRYIEGFYNKKRLHSSLGYKSPLDYQSTLN